jgi:hypothetical protein
MVLYALGDMKRISMTVTEEDLSSTPLRIKVAQAFAIVGKPEEAIGIIRIAKTVDYYECFGILTVFFLANLGLDEVKQQRLFPFHMIKVLTLNPVMWSDEYFAIFDDRKKKAFREWMEQLAMAAKAE